MAADDRRMLPAPAFRGAMCHGVLSALEAMPGGAAILATVDPAVVASIRHASKLAWVPYVELIAVNEALLGAVGEARYLEFWRGYVVDSTKGSLFSALFEGAIAIFGRSPAGLLRWIGRSWDASNRALGHIELEIGTQHAAIRVEGVAELARRRASALPLQGTVLAILDLTEHRGEAIGDFSGLDAGRYVVHARWAAPRRSANR